MLVASTAGGSPSKPNPQPGKYGAAAVTAVTLSEPLMSRPKMKALWNGVDCANVAAAEVARRNEEIYTAAPGFVNGLLLMGLLQACSAEARDVLVQDLGERGDHKVVVVALRQAGHHHAADWSCAFEQNGEAAAMRGVVGGVQTMAGLQRLVVAFEDAPDGVGTAAEAVHDIALATNPVGLAGVGGWRRAGEEQVVCELDLDGA